MPTVLYRPVKVIGQDFSKEKVLTQPNQSMSLQEIIRRFTRRESLPLERNGIYRSDMGDLEKQATEDFTVQRERATQLRERIKQAEKRMKDQQDARVQAELDKQVAAAKAATQQTPNSGTQAP